MENLTGDIIEARRDAGLSYAQIGAEFDATKDAVRGTHQRWRNTRLPLVDRPTPTVKPKPITPTLTPTLNFGYFDLESTALNGSFGRLHCAACKHTDGSVWSARIDDAGIQNRKERSDDRRLAIAIRDHLETHDILFSWNGRRGMNPKGRGGFDIPMLNARLVPEERIIRSPLHIDLLPVARKHLQLHSYRLAAVQDYLELVEEKTSITPRIWRLALDHDKAALDYIDDHCKRDVGVLKEVFDDFLRVGMLTVSVSVAKV